MRVHSDFQAVGVKVVGYMVMDHEESEAVAVHRQVDWEAAGERTR